MAAQYSPGICGVAPKRESAERHLFLALGELGLEKMLGNIGMTCCLPWVGPKWKSVLVVVLVHVGSIPSKISDAKFRPVSSLSSLCSHEPAFTTGAIGM